MKKSIAIFLVITIAINVLGLGFMNIRAEAEFIAAASTVVLGLVGGYIIGGLSGLLSDSIIDFVDRLDDSQRNLIMSINNNALQNGELIEICGNETVGFYFDPVIGLEGENANFAEFFCNKLNESENLQTYIDDFMSEYNEYLSNDPDMEFYYQMSAEEYSKIKSDCINAFNEYMAVNNYSDDLKALQDSGLFPEVDFSFTGPVDPINLPAQTTYTTLIGEGYIYTAPDIIFPYGCFTSPKNSDLYGFKYENSYEYGDTGLYITDWVRDSSEFEPKIYEAGVYIIYNGNIYRRKLDGFYGHNEQGVVSWIRISTRDINAGTGMFYDNNGISALAAGCESVVGLRAGFYAAKKPISEISNENYNEMDFIETTGGGTIEYPKDDTEAAIQEAIAAGLLPEDFMLKLNELGQIISANNIPIEKITSLLEQLKNGQMEFKDFESYLQYISALLSAGNVDRQTSTQILKNIKSLQEQTNNNIGVVNTAISGLKELDEERNNSLAQINANIAALTQALTATQEGDINKENIDLDSVVANHVGLSEANQFVSNWALMNQFKGLLYNVLDRYDKAGSNPPNFNFYWDSNKDGEAEKYTFLDLSILETTLSNNNLEDKERFKNEMTIRQFIQFLIILVCYVAFIIKMFRKLPGLVSGGESSMDTGFELGKAQKEQTAKTLKSLGKGD